MAEHHPQNQPRVVKKLADGWSDNLEPLKAFNVFEAKSADAMLQQFKDTALAARSLGEAADVLYEMVSDPKCFVVGTFSGVMTIAKMGLLIADMIEQKMLDAVVSTGALMCHGLVEQIGSTHFKYDPRMSDEDLYEAGYDRVYDTLELEQNLYQTEDYMVEACREINPDEPFGSFELLRRIGDRLNREGAGRGILQSAAKNNIPVYVPAFTDSELGLDIVCYNYFAERDKTHRPVILNPLRDVADYYERVDKAERLGVFTIGGGVPRNWAQQIGPLGEIMHNRSNGKHGKLIRFQYGVRICPEPTHFGGLSGCTYSEGISWGKFVPPREGGKFAEVYCDATIAWPLMVRGVLERMGRV